MTTTISAGGVTVISNLGASYDSAITDAINAANSRVRFSAPFSWSHDLVRTSRSFVRVGPVMVR